MVNLHNKITQHMEAGNESHAIIGASMMPETQKPFEDLAINHKLSDDAINQIISLMSNSKSKHNQGFQDFLNVLAHNLPDDIKSETLNNILKHTPDNFSIQNLIQSHVNYKPDVNMQKMMRSADFWDSYERGVTPSHMATIKSLYTLQPETIKNFEGEIGTSDKLLHMLPDLLNHALEVQEKIVHDQTIEKHDINGIHCIKMYKGFGGDYSKKITDLIRFNPETNQADNKDMYLPMAHMSSWTVDPKIAFMFANNNALHKDSQSNPNNAIVVEALIPISDILHSGFHTLISGQKHPNHHESELVIGHPEGRRTISTEDLYLKNPGSEDFSKAQLRLEKGESMDFESLEKIGASGLKKLVTAGAAATMIGMPSGAVAQHVTQQHANKIPVTNVAKQPKNTYGGLDYIKMIESSGGKNTAHKPISHGVNSGTTAIGQYGLTPLTVLETINKNPHLKQKYNNLSGLNYQKDQDKIKQALMSNPSMEQDIANTHWHRLYNKFNGDENKAAHAWYHGISGTQNIKDDAINNSDYVKKYNKYKKLKELTQPGVEHHALTKAEEATYVNFAAQFPTAFNIEVEKQINGFLSENEYHDLGRVGHFTHNSVIAGLYENNSWLIKVEEQGNNAIKSSNTGLSSPKEAAFYEIAKEVFKLDHLTPIAILGKVELNKQNSPCAVIKMFPPEFNPAVEVYKANCKVAQDTIAPYVSAGIAHKLAALLYILGDGDCHGRNVLLSVEEMRIIDHGAAFSDMSFNPGADENIFVPYFLRVFDYQDKGTKEEILESMPRVLDMEVRKQIKAWILGVKMDILQSIVEKYNLDPMPIIARHELLCHLVMSDVDGDLAVNMAWTQDLDLSGEPNEN